MGDAEDMLRDRLLVNGALAKSKLSGVAGVYIDDIAWDTRCIAWLPLSTIVIPPLPRTHSHNTYHGP